LVKGAGDHELVDSYGCNMPRSKRYGCNMTWYGHRMSICEILN